MYYLQSRYYDPKIGRFLNADVIFDHDVGIIGYDLFTYCGNNPVRYIDISGTDCTDMLDGDFDEDDPYTFEGGGGDGKIGFSLGGGGGSGKDWSSFQTCLNDALHGLTQASGERNYSGFENHHIISNKNSTYTPQYQSVTSQYGLSLDDDWNVIPLQNHRGRHTNTYHDFMLDALYGVHDVAQGNTEDFLYGFQFIIGLIQENPWVPYAH